MSCGGNSAGGDSVCKGFIIPQAALEGPILERVGKRFFGFVSPKELAKDIRAQLESEFASAPAEYEEVEGKVRKIDSEVELIVTGISPENLALVDKALTRLRKRKEVLEEELQRLESTRQTPVDVGQAAKDICSFVGDFQRVLKMGTPQELKRFLRAFVASVKVYGRDMLAKVGFYRFPVVSTEKSWVCMVAGVGVEPTTYGL